ncbi:MAG: aldehyde dehydrogenase EutE [Clostridiales Family XIII bacterium]|jgi:propionaldehyde dehydrogenase|nr:aldehyde dehydrogenase EutE [Clostridiales Family XIII bacterium]
MALNEAYIRKIVTETLSKLELGDTGDAAAPSFSGNGNGWLFDDANDAVAAAKHAQAGLKKLSLEKRGELIAAMRSAALQNAEYLAELAHKETGYGSVAHKIGKNKLAATKTPGIEDLHPMAYSGDRGLTIVEGAPYGVIGSITPSTNPTSTVINNSISMIAAGNSVVYNPHPAAKHASQEAIRILNEAVVSVGGPIGLMTTVKEPTLESGKIIMEHKDIPILAITGGEAVVSVAMRTGKKVIAAGPGNPPVIVDDTAEISRAAKDIVDGASYDNNVLCVAEKEVFALDSIFDRLVNEMIGQGSYKITDDELSKVVATVFNVKDGIYTIKREFVGRDATYILDRAGVDYIGRPRLVIAEVDKNHPFIQIEMLMPVLGMVRVYSFDEALEAAYNAEHGNRHSAMIHSTNIHNMSAAAETMDTTIFVKNGPSYSGLGFDGEGYATLTIATPTGEGLTSAKSFTRARRCVIRGDFRFV